MKIILQCHYHHQKGKCTSKRCTFPHGEQIWGYCPNGRQCPIKHYMIMCRIYEDNGICNEEDCSFMHPKQQRRILQEDIIEEKKEEIKSEQTHNSINEDIYKGKEKQKYRVQVSVSSWDEPIKDRKVVEQEIKVQQKQIIKEEKLVKEIKEEQKEEGIIIKDKIQSNGSIGNNVSIESNGSISKVVQQGGGGGYDQMSFYQKQQSDVSRQQKEELEEFRERLRSLYEDFRILRPLQQKVVQASTLDLLIIMDTTGSMSRWINVAKNEIKLIIDKIKQEYSEIQIRVGFIGYKDICDGAKNLSQECVLNFKSNIDVVKNFISNQVASGGGDTPEDIAGALQQAIKFNWQAKSRYAILVADAPCHGKQYHSCDDSYPDGDPKGRVPEEYIQKLAEMGVQIYGIKITDITNKMYKIFSNSYQQITMKEIQIAELGQSTQAFGFFIMCSVLQTISDTQLGSQINIIRQALKYAKDKKQQEEYTLNITDFQQIQKNVEIEEKQENSQKNKKNKNIKQLVFQQLLDDPSWESLQNSVDLDIEYKTYFIVKDKNTQINWKKPLIQESQLSSKIKLSQSYFSQGAMRYAFYMIDTKLNQKMVAKLPKVLDDNTYTLENMKKDIESVFICQHIVNEFNEGIVEIIPNDNLLLNFVHSFIFEIKTPNYPYKLYFCENMIEGNYEKYNNNSGWSNTKVNESSYIAQAFSHYSWQVTKGYLMIVDLQGVSGVLTDPQIHCLDYSRFGQGNLGYEGILKFFISHPCNHYCQHLGLVNPTIVSEVPDTFTFYIQGNLQPSSNRNVSTLCDLCKKSFKIPENQLYTKRIEGKEKYCTPCANKMNTTLKTGYCIDCDNKFRSSTYWFDMKRCDFPVRCSKCRLLRRDKLRAELNKQ